MTGRRVEDLVCERVDDGFGAPVIPLVSGLQFVVSAVYSWVEHGSSTAVIDSPWLCIPRQQGT